ncbi:DNA-directed RNA polymerase subunit alpha C-terminal domain-containing protein [Rhizobium sp. 18055]|uniref:DNA-directed RNA polymerase subunit alpha C-terminal domain-containing protein n=1 Tax=Rhizobium sp. 18055 TaxID=2681403 RepID=UPI00135B237B|nr:DNA-directed RNA polymerase subunit alpha C-terminal domain-containing protein [Rhizobium sp. 18055]
MSNPAASGLAAAMEKLIEDLKLSPATLRVLRSNNVETLEDLDRLSTMEIYRMPNMGGRRITEVLKLLGRERPSRPGRLNKRHD